MATDAPAASTAATEHINETPLSEPASTAATEHSNETPLSELLSQESGQTGAYELKVVRAEIAEYSYPWKQQQVATQKLQVLLQSHKPEEYVPANRATSRAKGSLRTTEKIHESGSDVS